MSQIVVTPDGKRHVFPDQASQEQIKAALASYRPVPAAMPTLANPAAPFLGSLKARALGLLPAAGGLAGGIGGGALAGVPGAIGGAAAGGAAGEAARQGLTGSPLSVGGIASQGAQQGAYEALGAGIAAGAGALARPVMRRALQVGKTLTRDFPNAVETTIARGIPVTKAGVAKAITLRQASGKALASLLRQAEATGQVFRVQDLMRNASELLQSKVLPKADKARIAKMLDDFALQHGQTLSPTLAKQIKQFYQRRASTVFRAEKVAGATLAQQNRGLFSREIARGAKAQLEQIPGVAAREAETQSLIGAQRAVSEAYMRPPRAFEIHKPGSYPILNSPAVISHTALVLSSPYFRALSRQSPRAAAALLFQLGAQDSTGASP